MTDGPEPQDGARREGEAFRRIGGAEPNLRIGERDRDNVIRLVRHT